MMTQIDSNRKYFSILRLLIILLLFPIIIVYVLPLLDTVIKFYKGDRAQWFTFWSISFGIEWLTLMLVLLSYKKIKGALHEIGLPIIIKARDRNIFLITVPLFVLIAIAGAGRPQDFLRHIPSNVQIFIPPSDVFSRLFWVAMALTAAICEEILWRGVAISELKQWTGSSFLAILISSFSFTFFHGGIDQGIVAFVYRFIIAVVLSVIYTKSGKLTWVIYIHFLMDAVALMAVQYD